MQTNTKKDHAIRRNSFAGLLGFEDITVNQILQPGSSGQVDPEGAAADVSILTHCFLC